MRWDIFVNLDAFKKYGETLSKTSRRLILIATLFGAMVTITLIWFYTVDGNNIFHAHSSDAEKQAALKTLIQGYIADGIILKIEKDSSTPNIYITPLFGLLTTSEKHVILEVVLNYFKNDDDSINSVDLFESQTEKPIGQFDGNKLTMQ